MTATNPAAENWNVDPMRIERNWRAITFELDAPRPGRIERFLRFLGLPAQLTRLVVATPALRRAWFVAVGLAVLIGVGPYDSSQTRENLFFLLLLAPLIPVLGVSFAYGVEADPAHEVSVATPMRGLRLIVTRAAVVLVVSVAVCAVAALAAPGSPPVAFGWLLPALGLTSATMAAMTVVSPRRAAGAVTVVWVLGVMTARGASTDPLAAFTAVGQGVMVAITVVGLGLIWARRDAFDRLEVSL